MNKKLREFFGVEPETVNGQIAVRTGYYRRQLRRIIKGCIETSCPEDWNIDYLLDLLLFEGYVVITDTSAGVIPLRSSLYGFNYANFPTDVKIAVPVLGEFERTLTEDAEIIYMEWENGSRSFFTFNEMVRIFAEKLASCDAGIDVNVMNSKLAYIAEADSKSQADTIKRLMDKITSGEPMVVHKKDSLSKTPMQLLTNNLKQNYIAIDLQDTKRTIYNEFLTALGVNNANTDKKERLITSEVDSNQQELEVNVEHIKTNLERCLKRVKKMFPELEFSLSYKYGKMEESGENNDTVRDNRDMETSK